MGVPLIATEVDGLGEIVNGKDGKEYALIIRPNNFCDIIDAMKYLKNNATAKKELAILGLERAKEFSWHTAAKETIEVYKKCL
jgi:glycosyltransferase involved in cell wall biosynthesis